jgi:chromosome segregation protein
LFTRWELAVEAVLGADLQAIRVDDLDTYAAELPNLPSGRLTLFEGSTELASDGELPLLATFARGEKLGLGALLDGIYAAESLQVAQSHRRGLANSESIITRDGLWFGRDWVRAIRGEADEMGIIQRAQEIDNLSIRLEESDAQLTELQSHLALARERVPMLEEARDELQQRSAGLDRTLGQLRADIGVKQVRIEEAESRRERLAGEREELATQVTHEAQVLSEAQRLLGMAQSAAESSKVTRSQLLRRRDDTTTQLDDVRRAARAAHDGFHALNGERGGLESHLAASRTARERLVSQRSELVERRTAIVDGIESSQQPLPELQKELADRLEERLGVEQGVAELRNGLDQVDGEIRAAQEQRTQHEAALESVRSDLENARVERQGLMVQQDNLQELFTATGLDFETVCVELPADASDATWTELLEKMERRINRLGPINLAAIDEFETQSERKTYLDAQFADLEEALETLQGAIRKIDKETRARFKATFEAVDKRLGELFPKVFGGGHASLELTGEDLLDTGVSLMARPPGKRNSSIHLLSGGEKALTAIALIFAIFHLNPSPVCLLDEVDAPLDDSNVQRFADLIKEMSAEVQFVVITHNKITMEMADHLMGVTMHEAGVSRLVSVDVEEAAELAAI